MFKVSSGRFGFGTSNDSIPLSPLIGNFVRAQPTHDWRFESQRPSFLARQARAVAPFAAVCAYAALGGLLLEFEDKVPQACPLAPQPLPPPPPSLP